MRVTQHSLADQLERDIRRGIYGEKLPGHGRLAKQYNTTHITLGKSMRLLEDRGLVTIQGTRGTFVNTEVQIPKRYSRIALTAMIRHENREMPFMDVVSRICSEYDFQVVEIKLRPEDDDESLAEYLSSMRVDGFVFLFMDPSPLLISQLRNKGIEYACTHHKDTEARIAFDADNVQAMNLALEKFVELGHERISYVNFNFGPPQHLQLQQAFRDFHQQHFGHDAIELFLCPCLSGRLF